MKHLRQYSLAVAHTLGFIGAIVLAFNTFTYDTAPIVVLAAVGLTVLGIGGAAYAAGTGRSEMWLVVGGIWVYDAVIAALRETSTGTKTGYFFAFAGYAFGALASYVAAELEG